MIFSPADIPIEAPGAVGAVVEQIRAIDPGRDNLSPPRIADLDMRIDDSVAGIRAALGFLLGYEVRSKTSVYRGETQYDEAIERRIESALGLEALRPLIVEVRRMLTPDDGFFEGEELDELAARAIEEDDRGATVEFRVMGE